MVRTLNLLKRDGSMKPGVIRITAIFLFFMCTYSYAQDLSYPTSFSFQTGASQTLVRLESLGSNLNRIIILTSSNNEIVNSRAALLPWPIYQFQTGDIDGDNITELFVGVIKACEYDPEVRRRLFVYEIIDGDIRAKWRGTYVSYDLKEFRLVEIDGRARIRTLEQDRDGTYHIITYAWAAFGPRVINNLDGGKVYEEAFKIYNSNPYFSLTSDNLVSEAVAGRGKEP